MLTKEQWFGKLKAWVPRWFFEREQYQVAVFNAIAKLLEAVDETVNDHFNLTFLTKSFGEYLDAHGAERNVKRIAGEPDALYLKRVQQIVNMSNKPDIKKIIDALLITGESTIIEHGYDAPFYDRACFYDRDFVFVGRRHYNYFTVLIDKQIPVSDLFYDRRGFYDRDDYLGTIGPLPAELILAVIIAAVESARAAGVAWRLIER